MTPDQLGTPIFSTYKGDPDMDEIVAAFVGELPAHVDTIRASLEAGDWDRLSTVAHQLKGAAGGYGFDTLTDAAATLEQHLKAGERDLETISREVDALTALCRRASA